MTQAFSDWKSAASQDMHAPSQTRRRRQRTNFPGREGLCSTLASQGKERDVGRLTPHEYQMMADLGQALSQSRAVALAAIPQALIGVDAWQDRIEHRQSYRRSQQQMRPYRWDIPGDTLRQIALYQVLEAWEKRQERQHPLTPKAFLIRYIKCLVLHTMMRDASHVAMALGCRLYRYHPGQIESLAPDLIAMPWRLRREIDQVIKARFRALALNSTREPTPAEQRLVYDILSRLAPWAPSHPNTPTPLAVLFAQPTSPQWGAQIHVLIDTQGACGLAQLIREYNASLQETRAVLKQWFKDRLRQSEESLPAKLSAFFRQLWRVFGPRYDLPDPDTHLEIPALPGMDGTESGADMSASDAGTFSPLTPEEIAHIEASLQLQQRRCEQYRPGLLQVCVDGEPVGAFDVRTRETWRLQLPRWASSVEVYGHDAEGPLLLAVSPIAGVAPYEMGRTVQFLLAVAHGGEGDLPKDLVTLTYLESPYATALVLWERGLQHVRRLRWHRGWGVHRRLPALEDAPLRSNGQTTERQPLRDHSVRWLSPLWPQPIQVATAADAAAREHTFHHDAGEIKISYKTWTTGSDRPVMLWIAWQADFVLSEDLWLRFTRLHDREALLAEVRLGYSMEGERLFRSDRLGFDPTREPWALALLLKERHA